MTVPCPALGETRLQNAAVAAAVEWSCAHFKWARAHLRLGFAQSEGGGETVPTGVALRDARQQLFDAAERVLLRDGPSALTSRAVTDEAGVAKGVLHRHFADFDGFLAAFTLDRIARLDDQAAALRAAAGTGTVTGNLARALTDVFGSVGLALMGLVMSRDDLRTRLRAAGA